VIGTLLALLVFFALFGIFLTQYVPLWMTDNEAQFTNQAGTAFLTFKSGIDSQYALGGPPVLGTPFTISSQSVPLLTQPTQGTLTFLSSTCPNGFYARGTSGETPQNLGQPVTPGYCIFENQTLSTGPGGSGRTSFSAASGSLEMLLPNRYYASQTFFYEDDGVVQAQSQGYQIMAFAPPFNVTTVASNTTVSSSFLSLTGNATTVIGQGSQEVYSHLLFNQQLSVNGYNTTTRTLKPFNYTFEIGTLYPCAWSRFLYQEMNTSGIPYSATPHPGTSSYNFTNLWVGGFPRSIPYTGSCNNPTFATTQLVVNMYQIDYATLFYAGVVVSIGVGGT